MRIGIDIDGVLADVLNTWVNELNQYFKQDRKREEIHDYRFDVVYEVSWQEMDKFFKENQELLLSNLAPIEKAEETIGKLKKRHNIILITARPLEYREITEAWLKSHGILYDEIFFTNFQDKARYCVDNKLSLFVEDSLENAVSISKVGIPVLLVDAPYNRKDLPNLVYRKRGWDEIYQTIEEWDD